MTTKDVIATETGSSSLSATADKQLHLATLFPPVGECSELTITCRPGHYSASAIAHAVEDADAHLLNLNVVAGTEPNSPTTVLLRVNHRRGHSVARSLERYGYETVAMQSWSGDNADSSDDVSAYRAAALLRMLDI